VEGDNVAGKNKVHFSKNQWIAPKCHQSGRSDRVPKWNKWQENPKISNIGHYWDSETMEKIIELLHKYSDLFPTTFLEMKGLVGELGEMKITLRTDARLVTQRPYILNPIYNNKVKAELDRIPESGIIEPMKESEWIIPIVVHENDT
jgi:hypothetical protein